MNDTDYNEPGTQCFWDFCNPEAAAHFFSGRSSLWLGVSPFKDDVTGACLPIIQCRGIATRGLQP